MPGFDLDQDDPELGRTLHGLVSELYPIGRSLTGPGVRRTLDVLRRHVPVETIEVPSGSEAFDWTIPDEWTLRDAWVARSDTGERVIDVRNSNLHVLGYSEPVEARLPLSELRRHLHTDPNRPEDIPYRTSYYERRWGFCLSQKALERLPEVDYDVRIDATLAPGHLTYGEYVHRGESAREVLFSAHVCHPSLANDNCSGLAVLALLARAISRLRTKYTYRFLFAPGTIGALAWLSANRAGLDRFHAGLVVSCLGDGGGPLYKRSRRGDTVVDRAMEHVLAQSGLTGAVEDFSPYGYDERQYCSPGFDLPVGSLQRSGWGRFPEYHTSADDLEFVRPEHLATSYGLLAGFVDILERDGVPVSLFPYGEPQLGRRGLYHAIGGDAGRAEKQMAMLWVLNLADGRHSLLDIARRARMPFSRVADVAELLAGHGLVERR